MDVLETKFQALDDFDVVAYTNTLVKMFTTDNSLYIELLCDNELMRMPSMMKQFRCNHLMRAIFSL